MEAKTYNQEGKEAGKINLPEAVFGVEWNGDLVHHVLTVLDANARVNLAKASDRGEKRGGGKKPWRQKGTGRARHGSNRSPIWIGGGVTHGPRAERNFKLRINKKMRQKALFALLSAKYRDGEILFLEKLSFESPNTKEAKNFLGALSETTSNEELLTKKRRAVKVLTFGEDEMLERSFQNISNVEVSNAVDMNVRTLLSHKYLVFSDAKATLEFLEKKISGAKEKEAVTA